MFKRRLQFAKLYSDTFILLRVAFRVFECLSLDRMASLRLAHISEKGFLAARPSDWFSSLAGLKLAASGAQMLADCDSQTVMSSRSHIVFEGERNRGKPANGPGSPRSGCSLIRVSNQR